jgi:hypothetical protein
MRPLLRNLLLAAALLTLLPSAHAPVSAHVGSPDVYFNGQAGPYHVLVTVRAPVVVPGVAEIDVRVIGATPREVRVVPLRLTGPGAVFAPVPDRATPSATNPRFFTASLWMMQAGPGRSASPSMVTPAPVKSRSPSTRSRHARCGWIRSWR